MGVVADLNRSTAGFKSFVTPDFGFRNFAYSMFATDIQFAVQFDPNSQNGVGGNTTDAEHFQIGIVQNELYSRELYVLEDEAGKQQPRRVSIEFSTAAVDMVASTQSYPFYSSGGKDSQLPPVANVAISSKGQSGPTQFGITDRSEGNLPKIVDKTFRLTSFYVVEIFQTWLIALQGVPLLPQTNEVAQLGQKLANMLSVKGSRRATVLATTEPFFMVFWADFDLRVRDRDGDPKFRWGLYGGEGYNSALIVRKIPNFGPTPAPKQKPGDGGRSPVLTGQIANVRGNLALMQKGLANSLPT